jgi:hypothetical protein
MTGSQHVATARVNTKMSEVFLLKEHPLFLHFLWLCGPKESSMVLRSTIGPEIAAGDSGSHFLVPISEKFFHGALRRHAR